MLDFNFKIVKMITSQSPPPHNAVKQINDAWKWKAFKITQLLYYYYTNQ
jgi:hypothetical protein